MSEETPQIAHIKVLYEKFSHLEEKIETCLTELKEARATMNQVQIDLAAFKARWTILAAVGSAAISGAVSLIVKFVGGH